MLTTSAAVTSGVRTVYVPITPCRLMDTRPPTDNVGPRATPLGAGETYVATVRGANGQCSIPADAVSVNVTLTAVGPTAASFLTAFPSDVSRPNSSNLNWVGGQAPVANTATVTLSAAGQASFFNLAGTVDLIVDIAGYYADHNFDDRYYTKAEVDALAGTGTGVGPAGPAGPVGPVGPAGPPGPAGVTSAPCSLSLSSGDIARLRWDLASLTLCPTGDEPRWVAFDGTNVWATNHDAGTVSRINAVTGSTTTVAVGTNPFGIAFDGTSMWVANQTSGTLSKINVSTLAVTTVSPGISDPYGVVFDGAHIWTNNNTTELVKIDTTTNAIASTVATSTGYALAFDGSNIWVPNKDGNTISRVNVGSNTVTGTVSLGPAAPATGPYGVVYDGTSVWVTDANGGTLADPSDGRVIKIDPIAATVVTTLTGFATPRGVTFDGTWIWVSNYAAETVSRINPVSGARTDFPVGVGSGPRGMVFDGTNLWVVLGGVDKLARFTP